MKNAIIIHGAGGNPNENWFPWLRQELENLGVTVFTPQFPTPEDQTLDNWFEVFEMSDYLLEEDTILIGHSLGAPFILNVLEKYGKKVAGCFFVAGFAKLLDHPIDEINDTFVNKEFDWEKIKNNSDYFYMWNGANDPYVPLNIAEDLAEKIDAQHFIVDEGGHLNATAGYLKFEPLLEVIRKKFSL